MMDFVEYQKVKRRMTRGCVGFSCDKCPLSSDNNKEKTYCERFEQNYPEEAVSIVEQWAKEHPVRTYKSVFLEKFPNAELHEDGILKACVEYVFGVGAKPEGCERWTSCRNCWNQEYKEQ